jgi:hypothetical protein
MALAICVLMGGIALGRVKDDPLVSAKAAFERGKIEYAAGRFEQALAEFSTAYDLTSRPALLFNLGLCAEGLGQAKKATVYYRLYLDQLPDAPDAQEVKAKIAALEAAPAKAPSVLPESPLQPAPKESFLPSAYLQLKTKDRRSRTLAPALLTGTGALVLAGGIITAIAAKARYEGLEASCAPTCDGSDVSGVRGAAIAADVLLIVGGAAAVAGATWLIAQRMARRDHKSPVQVSLLPQALVVSGRWP